MKKWLLVALSVSALAACDNGEEAEEPVEDIGELEEVEDVADEEELDEESELAEDSEGIEQQPVEEYAVLMPEAEQGLVDDPTVLANLHMVSEQYASLVQDYNQDWLEIWSGVVTMDPETQELDAYFLLVNGSGQDASNVTFTISVENEATGEVLFEGIDVSLSEEEYGVWGDQTVMPFSVSIPEESKEDVMVFMEQGGQGIPIVENMAYDTK